MDITPGLAIDTGTSPGVVHAYAFDADGRATPLAAADMQAAMARHTGWVWLHLTLTDTRCQSFITQLPLGQAARDILADADEHIRLDLFGEDIVGVLPDLHQEFLQEGDDLVRLHFAMTERVLITARRKPVHSIELVRRALEAGRRFQTPVTLLDAIIDQFADAIGRMSVKLGDALDDIEHSILHDDIEFGNDLGRVRMQAIRTRRQLAQVGSLFHRIAPRIDAETELEAIAMAIRTLAQKIDALDHDIGSLYERARLLQDEMAAKAAEITNKRLFTLSVLTACLLPPTLITGFFGMNTKDLPFQATDGGTWYALGVAFIAGGFTYWILKRLQAL